MGIFSRLFAGALDDGAAEPFSAPQTRVQLFRMVLKERFWSLMGLNILFGVFCVPAAAWLFYCLSKLELAWRSGAELPELFGVLFFLAAGLIPCLTILGPAQAGMTRVTRSWARDEHASIWQDFWDGFLKNWKMALIPAFFTSCIPMIIYWYLSFALLHPEQRGITVIPATVCALTFCIWLLALPTMYVLLVGYELKLKGIVKNAVIMTLAHPFIAVKVWLAGIIPLILPVLILIFASAPLGALLLLVYAALLAFSLRSLLTSSFANRLCEEFIHPKIGAPTRIGLRPLDEE